jgi:hypothetical protein
VRDVLRQHLGEQLQGAFWAQVDVQLPWFALTEPLAAFLLARSSLHWLQQALWIQAVVQLP